MTNFDTWPYEIHHGIEPHKQCPLKAIFSPIFDLCIIHTAVNLGITKTALSLLLTA